MQNWAAQKAISKLRPFVDGDISLDRINILLYNKVIVEGATIAEGLDTLAHAGKIVANVSTKDIIRGRLVFNRVSVTDGKLYLREIEDKYLNLDRVFRSPHRDPNRVRKKVNFPNMYFGEIRIKNFSFKYKAFKKMPFFIPDYCMDYANLDIRNIDVRIRNARVDDNVLNCYLLDVAAKDKCGFNLKCLSGYYYMDAHKATLTDMYLEDDYSQIRAGHLTFKYRNGRDLKDFVNKMYISSELKGAVVDFKTIGFFAPALHNNNLRLVATGDVEGTVSDMDISSFHAVSSTGNTSVRLSTHMKGLPNIHNTIFNGHIDEINTSTSEISKLISDFTGKEPIKSIENICKEDIFSFNGKVLGSIHHLEADGSLYSPTAGAASFDIKMENQGKSDGINIVGNIQTKNLDICRIIHNPILGKATISTSLSASIKDKLYGKTEVEIDSLTVDRLDFNGYKYSNLFAVGKLSDNIFDGRVICHDPNLHFLLQGIVTLSDIQQKNIYNCYADISFADLAALNIDKRGGTSQVSLRTIANIELNEDKDLLGEIDIDNLTFWDNSGMKDIGTISLSSTADKGIFDTKFSSPFLEAEITSDDSPVIAIKRITELLYSNQFKDKLGRKETINSAATASMTQDVNSIDLSLRTLDTRGLCTLFAPGLYIADSTKIDLSLRNGDSLILNLNSYRLGMNKNSIKNLSLQLTNPDSLLLCTISADKITIGDASIDNNKATISSHNGNINLNYLFNTGDRGLDFSSDISFERDANNKLLTQIILNQSSLFLDDSKWDILPSAITIGDEFYDVEDFAICNNEQNIQISGTISDDNEDVMLLSMNNFDLSIINTFIKNNLKIRGCFTGEVTAKSLFESPSLLMDIEGEGVSLFDNAIGKLNILSKYDLNRERINLLVSNKNEGKMPLNITGYFQPKEKYLNLNVSLEDFALNYIEPFVSNILTQTSGNVSGDLQLVGNIKDLDIISHNTRFNNFAFTPVFTRVPYVINGPLEFTEDGISFLDVTIHDQFNNSAALSGDIAHRFFKDLDFNLKLAFNNLQCLNTTEKDNSKFYGNVIGTGSVGITGPINNLSLNVVFSNGASTAIHVPVSSSLSATQKDLLSFKQKVVATNDPYENGSIIGKQEKKEKSNIKVKAQAQINPEAELFVEINKQLGDILKCKGAGRVSIDVNPTSGVLDLKGDYTISEGDYKFVLLGLTAKDLTLENGGMILFNGDIMSTTLDIGATYKTKASVSTLIADTSSVGNRRNVNCGLRISGPLSNPELSFNVDVPDLDPITKGRVEGALSTPDKVQKQFMALLLSGSFIPDEQSGIFNNSTILYSNASEMISNQFNNIFRQLDIPLDIGLSYQPGEVKGNDMFDVALSYQAFNNRVIINGNVGNSSTSSNTWLGNFEAEVKIDKQGLFRAKLFSRAADEYSDYLDNAQRNGLGITFQNEFDTFKEMIRGLFWSKKRREEYETKLILDAAKEFKEAK